MRRRRQLLKLVNSLRRLKCVNERLSSYRASAWWEYNDCGGWRSLSPEHAKRVEAAYVAGYRDACCHDPKNPSWEYEYDFEYMDLTCLEGAERKGAGIGSDGS